jgi:mannose-6-phosphate isomerase-like protein (cupin superfamily)
MPQPNDVANHRVNALLGITRPPLQMTVRSPEDLAMLREHWSREEAMPVVCERREDGTDQSWLGFDVRTYLRGEQSAGRLSVHSVMLSPGAGLPAHYHDDVDTIIMIIEGTPELRVGQVVDEAGPYSLAYAPARTRVGFRNKAAKPVWLNLIYLKAGLERAFASAHEHWDQTQDENEATYQLILQRFGFRFDDEPIENDAKTNTPVVPVEHDWQTDGDIEALRRKLFALSAVPRLVHTSQSEIDKDGPDSGFRKRVLGGEESGGNAMVNFVSRIPPAPHHYQPTEEELFFILDGSLRLTCGTESKVLYRGAMGFAPRNCTHAFASPGPGIDHKFMTINAPGGHEHAMAAVRKLQKSKFTESQYKELTAAGGFIIQ